MKPMRITGGIHKGRTVLCPPGIIRPAMARMREALFSSLGNMEGRSFLDLFAGSGIMAIEAASRGASPVVCVEKDRRKRPVLERNLRELGIDGRILIEPAEHYIRHAVSPFDVIYLDPPFAYPHKGRLLELVSSSALLHETTVILIHHPSKDPLPGTPGRLERFKEKHFGQSYVSFYRIVL
ncbi:methyltransferase [Spirochaeta thermophila DSM 6578]|uniref:Methyltransferase n=1 Tax=Winmispira thermophila (strain ATCC 700085 / DSM 6578 / Z-1203) TaxID=869211 RepID=G0GFT5_WINT7|nr:16S rRNA (guanine(966)-N(2))-methyltransferase RsmD [Spirochaeta thermophila]AEJ61628.1 methyltransferase [Spirochaeta thermophila DSM 6578]